MTRLGPAVGRSDVAPGAEVPRVPLRELRALWFQITGTLCNLACRHCFNASRPRDPWLGSLDSAVGASVHRRRGGQSVALGLPDCGCGYTDPRDNHFARISYGYTLRHTSAENRRWLGMLSPLRRLRLGDWRLLLCHGSPRQINEFLWETTTPTGLLKRFCRDYDTDVLCFTHTGIKWHRALPSGRHAVNVGAIGRPENDGTPAVWYTPLTADPDLGVEFVRVDYDHETLAREMAREGLPDEFIETMRTGWWTCCLESLPLKERARGRY